MRRLGFTLIELLVVVAIIAIFSAIAMPTISSYFKVSLSSAAREMASTIKETYNSSVMTGKVHRIAYDIKKGNYWVESGPPTALLETKESKEREERRKVFARAGETPPPSGFSLEKSVTHKKMALPSGASFEDVITQQSLEPITEGVAYSHFFPHGFTEQTIIHLQDESKHKVSLVISPLIGKTDLYERYITRDEAFKK